MKSFGYFSAWLIETVLQEAVLRFSNKFRDRNVNDAPAHFWQWVQEKMGESNWIPRIEDDDGRILSAQEVRKLVATRAQNRPWGAEPTPPPRREPTREPEAPKDQPQQLRWTLAKVLNVGGWKPGEHVVVLRNGENWIVMNRQAETKTIPGARIASSVEAIKDENGEFIRSVNPEELWARTPKPEEKKLYKPSGGRNPHILPDEAVAGNPELKAIEARFKKMMESSTQSHMMISALAGSGKTTSLKHLAWKFGKPGQKWLYLVFNTKNRVEAEEVSGGYRKFPEWVEVYTTNSFLGHVLEHPKNRGKIPQTERIIKLAKEGGNKIEKARIIADGAEFQKKIKEDYGIPYKNEVSERMLMDDYGVDRKSVKYFMGALTSLVGQIRKQFQERVLTLLGLLKSFGVNPTTSQDLKKDIEKVFNKYDAHEDPETGRVERGYFDSDLEEVKERIEKYKSSFRQTVMDVLHDLFGYDFMGKNYREEIIEAATWMLHQTLPQASNHEYVVNAPGGRQQRYDLGEFRDFNDDLWYAAIYSDKLYWEHYDVVLADEVQDFNEGQMIMLKKLHDAGAKIVAVGDANQAIYRFRGADSDAFSNLSKMLKDMSHDSADWSENSLSRNYRSRAAILKFVNERTHVKNLEQGKEYDDEGNVTYQEHEYADVFTSLKREKEKGAIKQTAFIARTNEPLVHAALKLLGSGIPFVIVGRDVASDLIKHINRFVANARYKGEDDYNGVRLTENAPVKQLLEALINFEKGEIDKHGDKSTKKHYLAELKDVTLALTASIETFIGNPQSPGAGENASIQEFKRWLEAKLGGFDVQENERDLNTFKAKVEKENPVILTTAHKSKGLEFERVYILRDDQFPHPKSKHPADMAQESNAQYVAYTRAMSELHIVQLEGQPGYKSK